MLLGSLRQTGQNRGRSKQIVHPVPGCHVKQHTGIDRSRARKIHYWDNGCHAQYWSIQTKERKC
jgi:hypothetical protein